MQTLNGNSLNIKTAGTSSYSNYELNNIQAKLSVQTENISAQQLIKNEHQISSQIINQTFLRQEKNRLISYIDKINSILTNIQNMKKDYVVNVALLETYIEQLQEKIFHYQTQNILQNREGQLLQQIESIQKNCLISWSQRIQIAQQIDITKLFNVIIQDKFSKAHQVFKWILVAFYKQSQSNYYWKNFKSQAYQRDQGTDLKQRLGRIDSRNASQKQKITTQNFIGNFQIIQNLKEFKGLNKQLQKLKQIAIFYRDSYLMLKKVRQIQKQIQQKNIQLREKEESLLNKRARLGALRERVLFSKMYENALVQTKKKIISKKDKFLLMKEHIEEAQRNQSFFYRWFQDKRIDQTTFKPCQCIIF